MLRGLIAAILFVFVLPANAQQTDKCAALSSPINDTSQSLSKMFVAMKGIDFNVISEEFSGGEREQFLKMAEIQVRLMPVFEEYLFELETLGLMMMRCSR